MATRVALLLIVSAVIAIAAAYGVTLAAPSEATWAAPALAYGIGASIAGLFVLGASRNGRLAPWIAVAFTGVFVVVTGVFWWVLTLPPAEGAGGPLLVGLPRRTALVLLGVGGVPTVFLPLMYAWAFDREVLREEDVHALHQERLAQPADGADGEAS
jgi:hypothetical protein